MSFLTFICGVRYIGTLRGGGVLWISSDGNDRMGAKIKTPKKLLDQELTPKKSHAEFPSLRKFGCTLLQNNEAGIRRQYHEYSDCSKDPKNPHLNQADLQKNPSKISVTWNAEYSSWERDSLYWDFVTCWYIIIYVISNCIPHPT